MNTANKLSYLLQTKELIRQAIVAQGVGVGTGDTFRSYAGKIESIGGGPSPGPLSGKYWRVVIYASVGKGSPSGTKGTIAELEFREVEGGGNIAVGGVPSANSQYSLEFSPDKAFDSNSSTIWATAATITSYPAWIQYEFETSVTIREILIQAGAPSALAAVSPAVFSVRVSEDGTDWVEVKFIEDWVAYGVLGIKTWTIQS